MVMKPNTQGADKKVNPTRPSTNRWNEQEIPNAVTKGLCNYDWPGNEVAQLLLFRYTTELKICGATSQASNRLAFNRLSMPMNDSQRDAVLAAAEKLFDAETLYKLAKSVSDVRRRKALRYWQQKPLAELATLSGVDVQSPKLFVAVFKGTQKRYSAGKPPESAEDAEARKELNQSINEMIRKSRNPKHGKPMAPPRPALNREAEQIGFQVVYSLQQLADRRVDSLKDGPIDDHSLHCCRELIRANHLGAEVQAESLMAVVSDSIEFAVQYFEAGKTSLHGWFRQLSDSLFLCCYCGFEEELTRICQWTTPRKKPEYLPSQVAPEIQQLHLMLANLCQPAPAKGFQTLVKNCLKNRKTRVRLLAEIIDAIQRSDQQTFEASTRKAIKNFKKRKRTVSESTLLAEWFPVHVNTAYYVGLRCGMTPYEFEANIAAYLCGSFPNVRAT